MNFRLNKGSIWMKVASINIYIGNMEEVFEEKK